MKEFGRGEKVVDIAFTIYGIMANPIGTMIESALAATFDKTGLTKMHKDNYTTDTDVNAVAKTDYLINVNENKKGIHKYSRSYRKAKIVRPTSKATKIEKRKSSEKLEKFKEQKAIISDQHPTKVEAIIKAGARVRCKAIGNGFAESGVASKTAVCVVGFCVNENGALKMSYVYDSGLFVLSKTGKEIAEIETTKLDEEINTFFNKLEKQLNGKTASEIKQVIEDDVKDDLINIFENWL